MAIAHCTDLLNIYRSLWQGCYCDLYAIVISGCLGVMAYPQRALCSMSSLKSNAYIAMQTNVISV